MDRIEYQKIVAQRGVLDSFLRERKRLGQDGRDEVWEGVLHLAPAPHHQHGLLELRLAAYLMPFADRRGGQLFGQVNVRVPGSGEQNFRIPDASYVAPEDARVVGAEGWFEGGPTLIVEIRSPGDDTYEKLPFYASVGVREALVIDRKTKKVEVFRLAGDAFVAVAPDPEGRLLLESLGVRLFTRDGAHLCGSDDRGGNPVEIA
jgi:Uma2 family endonuclease